MSIQFLDVGKKTVTYFPCTQEDLSSELIRDWLPSFAVSSPIAYLGWPMQLLEEKSLDKHQCLCIHPKVATSDRQWKGFVSWMLGVAGARVALKKMGYRWIAPASAFYQERTIDVDVDWPDKFPKSRLSLARAVGNKSKLRPDYLALKRKKKGQYPITSVEAKGTKQAIMTENFVNCPSKWAQQVRNIALSNDGKPLPISRYLVIGTRVCPKRNPSIISPLAIRAWNSASSGPKYDHSPEKVLPIVYASLFGLFQNLGQSNVAEGLAESLERNFGIPGRQLRLKFDDKSTPSSNPPRPISVEKVCKEKFGNGLVIEVSISDELAELTESLIEAETTSKAVKSFLDSEDSLDKWENTGRRVGVSAGTARLSCGVEVVFRS